MSKESKIFIAGHNGMVGSSVVRLLKNNGYSSLLLKTRNQLNLLSQPDVDVFFQEYRPDQVILCAAKVGGIQANIDNPAIFLFENLQIQNNIIDASYRYKVDKLIFLASSCVYPRECLQPMKEEYLFTGKLEPTNEGYAIAKLAGLKLVEFYKKQYGFNAITLIPCNLYGPNDSFNPLYSHVLSALVKKINDAHYLDSPELILWGSGKARREFMHVDDLAGAVLFFIENNFENIDYINIGTGYDVSILDLSKMIKDKVGYKGSIIWDTSRPDGMMQKCMDISKMSALKFTPKIDLNSGIDQMIKIYRDIRSLQPK